MHNRQPLEHIRQLAQHFVTQAIWPPGKAASLANGITLSSGGSQPMRQRADLWHWTQTLARCSDAQWDRAPVDSSLQASAAHHLKSLSDAGPMVVIKNLLL